MQKRLLKLSFLIYPLFAVLTANADIYKSVDADGHVTFSDTRTKGSVRMNLDPAPLNENHSELKSRTRTASMTPSSFPRVDSQTQAQRDDKRKQILLTELETEQKALEEAKKFFSGNAQQFTGAKLDNKSQQIQSDINTHQTNIQLIQKELAFIK